MPRGTNTNIFTKCRDQYQYFYKVQGPIPIVLCFFFNRKLTEGPIPIFLQSAGTNSKQKKVQGPMPKSDESTGTKGILGEKNPRK
jgi:hypothetical protein